MTQIKDCFTSRWSGGKIIEVDYSQLEVVGAAIISGDENLREDILNGVDSHAQSASWLHPTHSYDQVLAGYKANNPFYVQMRKAAKAPRFELQYGAGAASIARNNNIPLSTAKGFIERYYQRYSTLKKWQDDVATEVRANMFKTGKYTPRGFPIKAGVYRSITGRGYYFEEEPAPDWLVKAGTHLTLSPTKMKNYPIQGFSTGDFMPEMVGRVNRMLWKEYGEQVLLINTIHDSIILDVPPLTNTGELVYLLRGVMEEGAAPALYERWGIETDLPFKIGVDIGDSWGEMSPFNI